MPASSWSVTVDEPPTGEGDVDIEDDSPHPIVSEDADDKQTGKALHSEARQVQFVSHVNCAQKRTARVRPRRDIPVEFQLSSVPFPAVGTVSSGDARRVEAVWRHARPQ